MGVFDSKSTTNNRQSTDNRATQAGQDVSQNNVSLNKSKNNRISITNNTTDHGAISGALALAGDSIDKYMGSLETVNRRVVDFAEESQKQNGKTVQAAIDFADTSGRRVIDFAKESRSDSAQISKDAIAVVDGSNRRANDTANNAMDKVVDLAGKAFDFGDSQTRKAVDFANESAKRESIANANAIASIETQARRSLDMAQAASNQIERISGEAIGVVDANNRRTVDAIQRSSETSLNFAKANFNDTLTAMDIKDRREGDLMRETLQTVTDANNNAISGVQSFVGQQVESIKDFAKSVTVGNEEGTNRLLLALIIGAVVVAVVLGILFMVKS